MPVSVDDVRKAAARLAGHAWLTPLVENVELNRRAGGRILIKPEMLQHTGTFKFRGAYNRLSAMSAEERARGVVAFSSGNHAQGVAMAAKLLGVSATIVMPADAPRIKIEGTKSHGASIMLYDRAKESREGIARRLASETGAIVVPSFDDPWIIAGQGTIGLEIAEQARAANAKLDRLYSPMGGGGLMAGIALAMKEESPATELFGVEPEAFDDWKRSLASGKCETNAQATGSICDALLSQSPGEITFAINRPRLAGVLTVSDDEVLDAMAFALRTLKLVIEPGGAVALAALLGGKADCACKTVAIVLSGGNVDDTLVLRALACSA